MKKLYLRFQVPNILKDLSFCLLYRFSRFECTWIKEEPFWVIGNWKVKWLANYTKKDQTDEPLKNSVLAKTKNFDKYRGEQDMVSARKIKLPNI